ncbi:MAG: phosphoribosylformylglycinamidine cyclo-ligase [Clostridiales bacterium]|jgi:phosphoribosylformylglycinamidine cyclo-ligase|nr:phosphoribosylformylglycinamidine cyclo-ligase [Clostridiales bacterium]
MGSDYRSSGVDIEAGYKSVELIKKHVVNTFSDKVLTGIGGFGGLFDIQMVKNYEHPVLVSGTDGVGTKLKIAFMMDIHNTVGIDCVAMCVNDIVCSGAVPLFFLDYIACGKNIPEKIESIVEGVAAGCVQSGASLIGGETAEMPDFYENSEYDLAGFAVGVVDKKNIIDGKEIKAGDILIGLASSGVHSNGFSLIRKVLRPSPLKLREYILLLKSNLGNELIKPTKIYVKSILGLISKIHVKGVSHITGGGFFENIPRMLPKGLSAKIYKGSFEVLPIFKLIAQLGDVLEKDMYSTFNMGVGMVIAVSKEDAEPALEVLKACGETAYIIGEVTPGGGVILC